MPQGPPDFAKFAGDLPISAGGWSPPL